MTKGDEGVATRTRSGSGARSSKYGAQGSVTAFLLDSTRLSRSAPASLGMAHAPLPASSGPPTRPQPPSMHVSPALAQGNSPPEQGSHPPTAELVLSTLRASPRPRAKSSVKVAGSSSP